MKKSKVLYSDDDAIIRAALKQVPGDTVVLSVGREASNDTEVVQPLCVKDWDMLVLNFSTQASNGPVLIRMAKSERTELPILTFGMQSEEGHATRALYAGASGYLTVEIDGDLLAVAIRSVATGGVSVCHNDAGMMVRGIQRTNETLPRCLLSAREYQAFNMPIAGSGLTGTRPN